MKTSRWICLPAGLLAGSLLLADVDRTDSGKAKKLDEKPAPELGKPGESGKRMSAEEHEAIHQKLAQDAEENLKEIARLMEKIRNELSQKKTGDSTQNDQKETVRKLQELIQKLEKG